MSRSDDYAWEPDPPSVPDSPSTALQDQSAANDGGLAANEDLRFRLAEAIAVAVTGNAYAFSEPHWAGPSDWLDGADAVLDRLALPAMHCRDENGREMRLVEISRSGWLSHDESGDMVTTNMARNERPADSAPLYRLVEPS